MPLAAGARLGPYEVIAPIGAGGMGEVYKARDTRLERTVALKVLPATLAGDPEFRARFEREARSISALNHPHVCTLYDVGMGSDAALQGSDPTPTYLVMEYLEGETLAERLTKGPLPSDQVLEYAMQMADALDKAHRQGIVHRDLKPANVFLVKSGSASGPGVCKLLDFGLAKIGATAPPGSIETRLATVARTQPQQTTPLTAQGSILGTFQYMAPEQIEGQEADARTDIWAFGCVLYEMLTGRRAFEGKSQASLIASILERQPAPVTELQPMAPPALSRIVRTCLEKDPDNRFHTAHDLRLHLQWIDEGGSAAGLPQPVVASRRRRDRAMFAGVAIVLAALAALGAWMFKPAPEMPPDAVARFAVPIGQDVGFTRTGRRVVAISPDGTKVAFIANQQIYLRQMHEAQALPVRGTNIDPVDLTFSPDGAWLAFFVPPTMQGSLDKSVLKKIAVTGGTPMELCPADSPYGVRWEGNTVVFSTGAAIQAVSAAGGAPRILVSVAADSNETLAQPQLLNDGRDLLFSVRRRGATFNDGEIVVQPVAGGERKVLVTGGSDGRVLPSGHLVYVHDNTLFAQAFDAGGLQTQAGAVPIVEGVRFAATSGVGQFDTADNGTLVFVPGDRAAAFRMVWVNREGREEAINADAKLYYLPRVSPDGTQVAVSTTDATERDLWIWDNQRGMMTRLTSDPGEEGYPVWSRDGKSIYYRANPEGSFDVFRRAADGSGLVERLTKTPGAESPVALLPDGQRLLVRAGATIQSTDSTLMLLALAGVHTPEALSTPVNTSSVGEVSPDGRWLLYEATESSTQDEVWVRPFPNTGTGRWKISIAGGSRPVWSRSGREIFFRAREGATFRLMSVPVLPAAPGAAFAYGTPKPLFDVSRYSFLSIGRTYDVAPGDQRFIFLSTQSGDANTMDELSVIVNWFDDVRARVK